MEDIAALLSGLKDKKILVVGDMVVDKYRILQARRLSPEAPVVVFEPLSEELRLGGAGNVIRNLEALGVGQAILLSILGRKNSCDIDFQALLPRSSMVLFEEDRLTTIKERITTNRQQICRIDIQSNKQILISSAADLVAAIMPHIDSVDAIVFSDYDHGVCIPELISPILSAAIARGIPTIVDSKAPDTLLKYKGATVALPNMDEARVMTKLDSDFEDEHVARYLMKVMNLKAAAVTLGCRGIMLARPECNEIELFPPLNNDCSNEVVDVTGAGDTVAATVAAGLTLNMPYDKVMKLANVTAGIKVQKRGVATASPAEIIEAITHHNITI